MTLPRGSDATVPLAPNSSLPLGLPLALWYNHIMADQQAMSERKANINDLLPSDLLADDEVVIFAIKPSLWTIAFLSLRTVLVGAALAGLALWLGPLLHVQRLDVYVVEAAGIVMLARVGFAVLQWASRSYVLTDHRVIRIRGVFTIDIFQCALSRLQNTFLVLGFFERVLRLGTIEFATAGTGSVEALWQHIREPLKVHHALIQAMNAADNRPAPASKPHGLTQDPVAQTNRSATAKPADGPAGL